MIALAIAGGMIVGGVLVGLIIVAASYAAIGRGLGW
jgi:hypothetical protein